MRPVRQTHETMPLRIGPKPVEKPRISIPPITPDQIAAELAICARCRFAFSLPNGKLKCGHKDQSCTPCGQGAGLDEALKARLFKCPEGKIRIKN